MKISHVIGTSFIDYPKEIAMVVFTKGCNMTCPYCHNKGLEEEVPYFSERDVVTFLKKRKGLVDALVISGGEPTLHGDIVEFCRRIKGLDVKIKLDTNGTNPKVVKTLVEEGLVDYVAMDFKTAPEKYYDLCGIAFDQVKESIEIIKTLDTYEFRTTLYPTITESDIGAIVDYVGRTSYYLQQYRPNSPFDLNAYADQVVMDMGSRFAIPVRGVDQIEGKVAI
jgi:pyruvate formate lyase activating enzyme